MSAKQPELSRKIMFSLKAFNFNECHIIMENILMVRDKKIFLMRLKNLVPLTKDPILLQDLTSIIQKVLQMSEEEFQCLRQEAGKNHISFPPNFKLP